MLGVTGSEKVQIKTFARTQKGSVCKDTKILRMGKMRRSEALMPI